MSFKDDEIIDTAGDESGTKAETSIEGRTKVTIIDREEAPLEETSFKVLLELTGVGSNDRPGVDIVTVLNINQNMMWGKLEKTKIAMHFLIEKLTPDDRLSVVTFSVNANKVCPLRAMTESTKAEIKKQVNDLNPTITRRTKKSLQFGLVHRKETANVTAGLEMALNVLRERRLVSERVCAIMLMSDSSENSGVDVRGLTIGNVPVFTFGYAGGASVLHPIADNSFGGTFSLVDSLNRISRSLSVAFSQCLAGLLTVAAQDLKLTLTSVESSFEKISAGSYSQSLDNAARSVTITFGDLYNDETRKVLVDLRLPAVNDPAKTNAIQFTYSYSIMGKFFESVPVLITVARTSKPSRQEREEITVEQKRLEIVQMVKEARHLADSDQLDEAQDKMVEAQMKLGNVKLTTMIKMLKYEVLQLRIWMQDYRLYPHLGRDFALASETSHDRQRYAMRGDADQLCLFATPCMTTWFKLAKSHERSHDKPAAQYISDLN